MCQELYFDVGIIDIKLFVLSDFSRHDSFIRIGAISAADDLTEGAFIYDFSDQVPVSEVLSYSCVVESVLISNRILILPPHITDRVNSRVVPDLNFLKFGQLVAENLQSFLRAPAIEGFVLSLE